MPNNKPRVYLALYFRPNLTDDPDARARYGHAAYRWLVQLAPKDGSEAINHYVMYAGPSTAGSPGTYTYMNVLLAGPVRARTQLCTVMIGKLPPKVTVEEFDDLLNPEGTGHLPVPDASAQPPEDDVSWIRAAVTLLQTKKWAEADLNVNDLMDFCLARADECYAVNPHLEEPSPIFNATTREM